LALNQTYCRSNENGTATRDFDQIRGKLERER
jgi:hypothetical protein